MVAAVGLILVSCKMLQVLVVAVVSEVVTDCLVSIGANWQNQNPFFQIFALFLTT